MEQPEKQDLHEAQIVGPDRAWAKPDLPQPSEERLKAKSSWVNCCNTGNEQTHVVIDRYMVGHEIAPGQTVRMEMLDTDVDYFIERRKTRTIQRIINSRLEQITVRHPIEVRDEFGKPLRSRKLVTLNDDVEEPASPAEPPRRERPLTHS